jgi:hypothetical protein
MVYTLIMVDNYYSYVIQSCNYCMHDGTTVNDESEMKSEGTVMAIAFHSEASSTSPII